MSDHKKIDPLKPTVISSSHTIASVAVPTSLASDFDLCSHELAKDAETVTDSHTIDEQRRRFLLNSLRVLGGVGALCAFTPFLASWNPSEKIKAASGPIQVDLTHLQPGQQMTVEWRGKPIWIIRRTPAMLKQLNNQQEGLRDPDSRVPQQPAYARNQFRSIKPEYLVLVGLCTHLGCSPLFKPDGVTAQTSMTSLVGDEPQQSQGGFYCPCHGSRFDLAGRVYKGVPAPINLEVPPYRFLQEHVLEIGEV